VDGLSRADARRQAAAASVGQLRNRLLDLTGRNPLVSFPHSARSGARVHVRAVNGHINDLLAQLADGKALAIRPLPASPDEPDDEWTEEFLAALERARSTDEEYQSALARLAEDEQSSQKAARLERGLRDKVRNDSGLPPWAAPSLAGLADYARQLGIDPELDLAPVPADCDSAAAGRAAEFQALLMPDILERHLSKIRDTARTAAEETGVSTLHLACGFLEWFESDSSDRKLTSPLLLIRVDMERKIVRSHYQYSLISAGDDAEANLTLAERLNRDFKIQLFAFDEDAATESYLAKVRDEICAGRKRWAVRHFATLAHFPFARLAMFHDLEEALWTDSGGLPEHPLLGQLLGGAESAAFRFADEHDVDAPDVAAKVPLLVLEADASQHSATYDVMTGKNVVIEGPPGTGKSQTITNIIAAALACDKRVLFMAEKQAALQVVKDRLDKVGLGDFCLELHSGKARKKDVLDALQQRLTRRPAGSGLDDLGAKLRELSTTRIALTHYVKTLNVPFGAFGATLHDILWADRRRRDGEDGDVARRLDAVMLPSCETLTQPDIDRRRSVLDRFDREAQSILSGFGTPRDHPWFGITRSDLPSVDFERVTREVGELAATVEQIIRDAAAPGAIGLEGDSAIGDLRNVARAIARLPAAESSDPDWYRGLAAPEARGAAEEWLRACEVYRRAVAELRSRNIACDGADTMEAAESLASNWAGLSAHEPSDLCVSGLVDWAKELRAEAERIRVFARTAAETARLLGVSAPGGVRGTATLLQAVELVVGADDWVIEGTTPELAERSNREVIVAASAEIVMLRARAAVVAEEFSVPSAATSDEMRRHAAALRDAGLFGFLSSAKRAAARHHAGLRKASRKSSRQEMASSLTSLAEHLDAVAALEARQEYRAAFGRRFRGLATDTDGALAVADWAVRVQSELAGMDEITLGARRTLLSGDQDRLQALRAFGAGADFAAVRGYIRDAKPPSEAFDTLIASLDETAEMAATLAEHCGRYGIPMSTRAADLPSLCALLWAAHSAWTGARVPESLIRTFAGRVLTPLDDHAPFRAALALAAAVSDLPVGDEARRTLQATDQAEIGLRVAPAARAVCAVLDRAFAGWRSFQDRVGLDETDFLGGSFLESPAAAVAGRLRRAARHPDELGGWIAYLIERVACDALGLGRLLALWDERAVPGTLSGAFDRVLYHGLARVAFARHPELDRFTGLGQDEARARFKRLDAEATGLRRRLLADRLAHLSVPGGNGVGKRGEYTDLALIHLEISKQKRHIPIRQLLDRAGDAIQTLKPCFMMSPLSVAQYLKPVGPRFDLLVIDEASQMRPEDALGAIARSGQIVVVGDSKQLPPTSFFARLNGGSDEEDDDEQEDAESILDLAQRVFRPMRRLRWHYRSRHGSLVAFSNRESYDDDLIVFPSPSEADATQGVATVKVDGVYKARSNVAEVAAVCAAAVEHMRHHPERSLGIATMNQPQRELIAQEMDTIAATHPEVEVYRRRWSETLERFFVKNLENVQGDERDVIFISTVFGPSTAGGRVKQVFGPINGKTGHRRLNVLFTRAKHHVRLFTSMTPDDVLADGDSPRGAQVLKAYLAYAADGRLDAGEETGREADSDFEVFVRDRLRLAGYDSVPQVGVAGFYIDLAVRHPDAPGTFLLGVECDGASYHSSRSARDRDILRQQVLEGLGWTIYRIWSTDWFRDPAGQIRKLVACLDDLRRRPLRSAC